MSKERCIIFSAPMVRAILEGRKSMTRRIVKPQSTIPRDWQEGGWAKEVKDAVIRSRCPYGVPGDRLWVRETFLVVGEYPKDYRIVYSASNDGPDAWLSPSWKPPIFMPRWASRITLEVAGVKVERVRDISEGDAKAEGVEILYRPSGEPVYGSPKCGEIPPYWHSAARNAFELLWQSIHGPGSWERNDWVWCLEFRKVTPCQ
jgi:hypothetical protein